VEAHGRGLLARLRRLFSRAFGALVERDRRRAFGRELFYRLAARFTPAVVAEGEGGLRFLVATNDHGNGMTLFMGAEDEREALGKVIEVLKAEGLPSPAGRTMIDVGAHVGTATVTALDAFGFERAICFEPSPQSSAMLRANLAQNGVFERAVVHQVALSDRAGTATFELAPMNPSDGRIRVGGGGEDALGEGGWETIEVPTATLDSFVESGAVDLAAVGLVWIDAQGHEGQILSGAGRLLEAKLPTVIELWPYGLQRAGGAENLFETVSSAYDRIVDLGAGGPPRPSAEIGAVAEGYWGIAHTDLLLLP
jgi:FkbM family methyltransferase